MPVLNEAATVGMVCNKLIALKPGVEKEVIIVDDGSTDGTREILYALSKKRRSGFVFLFHDATYGKGAAIRSALTQVTGTYVVIHDADTEYDTSDITKLLAVACASGAAAVYGSRNKDIKNKYLYPLYYWGGKGLAVLINLLYKQQLTDPVTCYKLIQTQLLRSLNLSQNGFGVDVEMTCKVASRHYLISEVSVSYRPRSFAEGKKIRIKDGLWAMYLVFKYRIEALLSMPRRHSSPAKSLHDQAVELHKDVPPDWYESSIKTNMLQRFWHNAREKELKKVATPVVGEVLDIGCADGYFSKILLASTRAKRLVGIDVLRASVNYAKKRYRKVPQLTFKVADAHTLPFRANSFSAVFSIESLEHVIDPQRAIFEMRRVLKKNGYMVILIPSENTLFKIIWSIWTKGKGRVWKDSHVHIFHPHELPRMVEDVGFKNIQTRTFLAGMLLLVKAYK